MSELTRPFREPLLSLGNGDRLDVNKLVPLEPWLKRGIREAQDDVRNNRLHIPVEFFFSLATEDTRLITFQVSEDRVLGMRRELVSNSITIIASVTGGKKRESLGVLNTAHLIYDPKTGKIICTKEQAVYIRGIEGTDPGECVLVAGEQDFGNIDSVLTLRRLIKDDEADEGKDMLEDVMRRSGAYKLREAKIIHTSSGDMLKFAPYQESEDGVDDREDPAA